MNCNTHRVANVHDRVVLGTHFVGVHGVEPPLSLHRGVRRFESGVREESRNLSHGERAALIGVHRMKCDDDALDDRLVRVLLDERRRGSSHAARGKILGAVCDWFGLLPTIPGQSNWRSKDRKGE